MTGHRKLALLALIALGLSAGAQNLVLDTDDVYPRSTPDARGFEDLILKEAFGRLGITVSIQFTTSERALLNVNQGIDDGLFVKVAGVEAGYPNLVMVRESVCQYDFAAFGKDPSRKPKGWAGLAPYNVAFIRGWKAPEANVTNAKSIIRVKDDDALFEVLLQDRVDLIVYEALEGRLRIKDRKIAGVYQLGDPLASVDMYLYLNVRHRDLVPGLEGALRAMKADGSWKRIIDGVTSGL